MTAFTRKTLEKECVNLVLDTLRAYVTDPLTPARPTTSWIRTSVLYREEPQDNTSRKSFLVKESAKAGFPQVIVSDFNEINTLSYFYKGSLKSAGYKVNCELTLRVLDKGDITRISNLCGQISDVLMDYKNSKLINSGISNLNWTINTMPPNFADDYFEKQILLTFTARVS